jgi:glucosamine kinase
MANILVADSGSTKTEWTLLADQNISEAILTSGINPYYQNSQEISAIIQTLTLKITGDPDKIFFYGAGCGNQEKRDFLKQAIRSVFKTSSIFVESDLLGAARSLCQDNKGIACILGTGSNSCYYDGTAIARHISPLGYILGDEGSGAVLGKKIVSDILKNQLPPIVGERFFETYHLDTSSILDSAYKQPFPNRYLAQFSKFISGNIEIPEVESIVIASFTEFINRNVLQYEMAREVDINFTGSIAFHFREQLIRVMDKFSLKPSLISKSPSENLVRYHLHHTNL